MMSILVIILFLSCTLAFPLGNNDVTDDVHNINNDIINNNNHIINNEWRKGKLSSPLLSTTSCTIDVITHPSQLPIEEFQNTYYHQRPLVLRGAALHWNASKKWTKDYFMTRHPYMPVRVGGSEEIGVHGTADDEWTLLDFIMLMDSKVGNDDDDDDVADGDVATKKMIPYLFDSGDLRKKAPDLMKDLGDLPYFEANSNDAVFFIMGAAFSGVPFHKHADAWNVLFAGRKRWCVVMMMCMVVFFVSIFSIFSLFSFF